MILFLYGDEPYLIHERLRVLRAGFVKKYDELGVSETVIEGDAFSLDDFARALHSGGLFTKKRLVILRDPVKGIRDTEKKQAIVELLQGLARENVVAILVEHQAAVKGADPLFTYAKSLAHAERFDTLVGEKLERWIHREVTKRGGAIEPKAASELARRVGNNMWRLSSELDKLIAYAASRVITTSDVKLFSEDALDENVFHLTDALGEQNAQLALKLVDAQLKCGTAPLALLSTLTWHWKTLVRVKRKIREGVPQGALAQELGIHPFVAEKAARQAARFPVNQLNTLFDHLLEIDRKLKTTREDPALLFDLFVVGACRKATEA